MSVQCFWVLGQIQPNSPALKHQDNNSENFQLDAGLTAFVFFNIYVEPSLHLKSQISLTLIF